MGNAATFLWVDGQYDATDALLGSLGDRFLLHHNALYRHTRKSLLLSGYSFVSDASRLCVNYRVAPLLTLDVIYREKKIPFEENSTVLAGMGEALAGVEISEGTVLAFCKKNVHFHEALHCVAKERLRSWIRSQTFVHPKIAFVIESAYIEAFANAVERVAFFEATVPLHLFYLQMNSYVSFSEATVKLMRDLVEAFSLKNLLRMAFCVLCILNLRAQEPSREDLTMIAISSCNDRVLRPGDLSLFRETAVKCWGLSKEFRTTTADLYYRLHQAEEVFAESLKLSSFSEPAFLAHMLDASKVLFAQFFEVFDV